MTFGGGVFIRGVAFGGRGGGLYTRGGLWWVGIYKRGGLWWEDLYNRETTVLSEFQLN